jgi:pimeloyl-ACP methyl ester carboxylesterase
VPPERVAAIKDHTKSRGLIVGFEGLQPFSGYRISTLTHTVGHDLGLVDAATSGNRTAHLPLIAEAAKAGLPIYIVGYSMGGEEGRRLAELCKERNIPVRILFLLDPRYLISDDPGKVPDNVARAVFYTSTTYDIFVGTPPTRAHLADPTRTTFAAEFFANSTHTGLPSRVTDRVRKEIAADLAKVQRPVRPSTQPEVPAAKTQRE